MDGSRFDALAQRLAAIRLTRGGALRGMAVSALTLTGIASVADEASADKNNKKWCACKDAEATCTTEKGTYKERKRYRKAHPCSYNGRCVGTGSHNPCEDAGVAVTVNNTDLLRIDCTADPSVCGTGTGLACLAGRCLPLIPGDTCGGTDTCSAGKCVAGACICSLARVCESESSNDVLCCVAEAECINGVCLLPVDSL